MAERYGTIPQKFTKEWWEYFWMYYKWHTISIFFAVVIIGFSVYSTITAEKYDLTLTYAGGSHYSEETIQKLEDTLSPLCKDIDENGESSIFLSQLDIDFESQDYEYLSAMLTKLDLIFAEDETYLFILNKDSAERYKGESADKAAFAPLADWLTTDISDMNTYSAHGEHYGVDISNLKIFKDLGMDMTDHYLFMRYYPRKDQEKKQLKGYNAAIELANKILEN